MNNENKTSQKQVNLEKDLPNFVTEYSYKRINQYMNIRVICENQRQGLLFTVI